MEFPLGVFYGLIVGIAGSLLLAFLVVQPRAYDEQFGKDCKAMAHGTIDKSARKICAKDGKILFHE